VYQVGINKGIILRYTAYQISRFTTTVDLTKHICQNNTTQETHKIYLPLVNIKKCILEQIQVNISSSLLLSQNSG